MNWLEKENWYAPLQGEEQPRPEEAPAPKPERKKRRRDPRRWTGPAILSFLLMLIVLSSLIFSRGSQPGAGTAQPEQPERLPESAAEFFREYYETTETDQVDTGMPRVERSPDFTLRFAKSVAEEELSLQELYQRCAPSIVAITGKRYMGLGSVWGSGVILSSDGLILTNCHMVENCESMEVTLWDDRGFAAKLVGCDAVCDLAVLQIDAHDLPAASFGDSAALAVGDRVAAIGNPLSPRLRSTLTDGIISSIERGVPYNGHSLTLLQTNAAINDGSSGGALFNMYGQVIGITNMKMSSAYYSIEGIGFAIPSTTVRSVVNDLCSFGSVRGRTAVGVTVGEIPPEAKQEYGLPDGLYVSEVVPGSDAEAQGIRPGDVITAVEGVPVTTTGEVSDLKEDKQVGDVLHITLWREGKTLEIGVRLMEYGEVYPS